MAFGLEPSAQMLSPLPIDVHNAGYLVTAIAVQADGKMLICGSFTEIGSTAWAKLARINPDGTLDTTFVPPQIDGGVDLLAISGSTLYLAGSFTTLNGIVRMHLAAIDLNNGSLLPWNPAPDGAVTAMTIASGILYVGGTFTHASGVARNSFVAFTIANGAATAWNPNAVYSGGPDAIRAILPATNTVYLAGYFDSVGGQPRLGLAQVDMASGAPTAWNPQQSIYGEVNALTMSGNTVFAGGDMLVGENWYGVAALDGTTGAVTWGDWIAPGTVSALLLSGSTLYAGGGFDHIGGAVRGGLAALDAGTGQATAWNPIPGSPISVRTLAQSGNTILVGGGFSAVNNVWIGPFARIDATTGTAASAPTVSTYAAVDALYRQDDGKVVVGGGFTQINGVARHNLARLNTDGNVDATWNPGSDAEVMAISASDTTVYVASISSSFVLGGQQRKYLGAVDAHSGAATTWNPAPDGYIYGLLVANGQLYVGGVFNNIGSVARKYLAAFTLSSGAATAFDPAPDGVVNAMVVDSGNLYVGGNFTHISGQPRNLIAALDPLSGAARIWNPAATPDVSYQVNALVVSDHQLIVGGSFGAMGGVLRPNLVALNLVNVNAHATAWNSGAVNDKVRSLAVSNQTIYASGDFNQIGTSARNRLAALDSRSGAPRADWAPDPNNSVFAVAASDGLVYVGGNFTSLDGAGRNALGAYAETEHLFADGFQ